MFSVYRLLQIVTDYGIYNTIFKKTRDSLADIIYQNPIVDLGVVLDNIQKYSKYSQK